jgi:hypothetical protein
MALCFTAAALALSAASMVQAQDSQSPVSEQDRRILQLEQLVEKMGERVQQLELELETMGRELVSSDRQLERELEAMVGEVVSSDEVVESGDALASSEVRESGESLAMNGSPPPDDSAVHPGQIEGLNGGVRDTHQIMTSDDLVSDEFPASWPMFGTDTRMKIGGYIKGDFVADFDGTLDSRQFLMRTIPVEGTPEYGGDPYVDFFANDTRFNLDIRRIIPGAVPLRGFIEGDFFTPDDKFRLRHAYITAGDFTIGQTWTNLTFLEAIPIMIDFAAGDALFGGRAAQIRYTNTLNDRWELAVSAEDLQFLGIQNSNGLPGKATTQWPLFTARADYNYDGGMVSFGASIGQLHWDGFENEPSDSAAQYALLVGGRQNIGDRAFATYHLSYTEGAGENIMAFAGTDANAVLEADGTLTTFPSFAAVIGFGYDWSPSWTIQGSYAYGVLDTPESRGPLELKAGGIGHLNVIWSPVTSNFSAGAEIMYGKTRVQNDATGTATRFQLMAKYSF